MDWLLLALITPILWSIVTLIDDNLLRNVYRSPYIATIISGFFGLLPVASLLWLDVSTTTLVVGLTGAASGFLTVMYYFFYFQALEKEAPSVVIALMSLTPVTLPFLAYVFLDENLSKQQILGFAIVLAFTFFLAVTDVRKFKFTKALGPILTAVILMNFVLLTGKYTYDHTDFYTGFMYFSTGMGLSALFFSYVLMFHNRYARKKVLKIRKRYIIPALIGLVLTEGINIAAEFTSNLAISKGPVSLVEVLQNTQPMYMLLIAILLYPIYPAYFREAGQGKIGFKLFMMSGIIAGVAVTVMGSN